MDRSPQNRLARFAIERRVTMIMILAALMVLGWLSLERLPLEFLPTFSSSSVTVRASYPSSSPEEIEREVLRPLEDSLGTINGIDTLSSTAEADGGSVRLTFVDGTDMDMAAVDVRDRLDRARRLLPSDLDRITIRRFQSTDIPVLNFHLSSHSSRESLFDFAENVLQRRLERIEGVAQVTLSGLLTPKVQVDVDPDRMRAAGLSLRLLAERIRGENLDLTAGDLPDGGREVLVRVLGAYDDLDELRRLPIGDGLRLGDVASVRYDFPRQEEFNYLNGREALTVRINKTSTANLLAVVERVKAELAALAEEPEARGFEWRVYHDASRDVSEGLAQLRNAGLFGGGLAVLAVFLFLRRVRTTLLVALAIPVSVVATFVGLYFLRRAGLSEVTLNVVSLAGLMLALGMLVDNSIVVIESIFRHRNELGEDSLTAGLTGTTEVALPIVASTATTLCVFLPIVFLGRGGWMQTYLANIATTVCIVMVASLLVALTVVPMAAVVLLRHQSQRPAGWIIRLRRTYGRALRFTLHHRLAFFGVVIALLGGSIYLFGTIERSFTQRESERMFRVDVDVPRQYSLEQTRDLMEEVYRLLDARREELEIADIAYSFDRSTGRAQGGWQGNRSLDVYLVDESQGRRQTAAIREQVVGLLPRRAGVELRVGSGRGGSSSSAVEIELMGDDPAVLQRITDRVVARLEATDLFTSVDTNLSSGDEEVHVAVDPELAERSGLSARAVAGAVSSSLSSRPVSRFRGADREVDLVLQLQESDRATLEQLRRVPLEGEAGSLPLESLASFRIVPGAQRIERENHQAKVTVTAVAKDARGAFAAAGAVGGMLSGLSLPPGYSWSFGRWTRFQQEDQSASTFALLFALVLVYMLMAALFESFSQPFVILFSVPFALLGVAVVMKLTHEPLETMTNIGLIILLGVVVNNAIVLLDHINRLRAQGLSRDEAIVQGGQHRLRPILITAITTLVGLLPMVLPILLPRWFGPVEGRAGTWAPIGLVIFGGLTTSTFLTLGIIPTVYSVVDDLTLFCRRAWRLAAGGRRTQAVDRGADALRT
ncbi:MAG: efflux RND transporter permease subunit [Thermoanaerobaculia bacterium]